MARRASLLAAAVASSLAAAEPSWQLIECLPADLPVEAAFELVRPVDDFENPPPKWRADAGGQNARATIHRDTDERYRGDTSLRVDYEFVGNRDYEYIQLNGTADFTEPSLGFGFWYKSDGTPFALRLRVTDTSGECHQTELLHSHKSGWQFVAGSLDGPSEAWGGDGNRRKDYPCKLAGICVDRPGREFVGKGSLWIDDLAVVRPTRDGEAARAIQVETPNERFGNLFAVGDSVTLRASGEGERLRWTWVDFFEQELAKGEGPAASIETRFALKEPGWFTCRLELLAKGRVAGTRLFHCAALPGGREPAASDFLGVCSHYGQSAYPLETMELMRRYGIDQFRDEISWHSYEREKGTLALPSYAEKYLKRASELKLRPLIIYDYSNPHYDNDGFPNSAEAVAAFTRYAVDLTRQTRGVVSQFEVWNEWVGGCGMTGKPGRHDAEAYGRLLKPVYQAVKREFPDVTVVGIGGEYGAHCAETILGVIRTAGPDAMDAWSIHPYRYPRPPEGSDLVGDVRRIAAPVAGAGVKTKAWITEIGYPTHRGNSGSDLAAQARHAVRTLALLQSMHEVGKVFWYDFKDDGLTREYNEHNFGVVHHQRYNCAPKPAVVAMSVFIRQTDGAVCRQLVQAGDTFGVSYRHRDGGDLLIAWSASGDRAVLVGGDLKSVTDLMGKSLPTTRRLTLTGNPVFLAGRNLKLEEER